MSPLEEYEIQRDDFHKEHQLIANRTTWFVTSQSFLVTAFVIARPELADVQRLVPWVGIFVSVVTLASVMAAARAMKDLRIQIHRLVADPELKSLPGLHKPVLHFLGMAPPVIIPLLFFAFWIYCALRGHPA
jgi:FtsH-binding integral membrane protein